METVRWGIIGVGDVTEVKSGPGFRKAENSRLVAVMRRNGALAEDYAKRHGVPKWYDNAQSLIHDPEVDAVYIATPPAHHKEYTIEAAKVGKPVYVEKPMAMDYAECRQMITACEQARVPLYVAYYRRALPRFLKVQELLKSGAIGEVRFVTSTQLRQANDYGGELPWRVQPHLSGGGLFFDMASHTLDLLDFLFGPITEADGRADNQGGQYAAEDIVTGTYKFASGVYGMGTWCYAAYTEMDLNEIIGTKGKLSFSTLQDKPIVLTTGDRTESWMIDHPPHVQQPLIQSIVDELTGKQTVCPSDGISGARTSWVIEQMVKQYTAK
ncbi:Gfo/Idh/MocA family protein [Paenibacillus piri]|uniref:Gfo/Idh/MocA family oxidoreductase n=1 Tax=Paenibacillus piri TaxID=2547395 RepID=A0A4R5KES6_9BACL|nr:Gfo/Idh/MocA family oxidoreductase [Paenibacillus piri]TDF93736.1 Gfo/Idh/MocA family oxidoreductase [Paenibacillus piri]